MALKDSAPNEEVRKELVKLVGVLILIGRKTTLPFEVQHTVVANLLFGGASRNHPPRVDLETVKDTLDRAMGKTIVECVQYLPQEIKDSEGDLRRILLGCTNKNTKALLEEYYFEQTGDRIGKNDAVTKRILEEGL